jgi:5-aminolevulinate synthase
MIEELRDALLNIWELLDMPRDIDVSQLTASKLNSGDLTLPTIGG